MKAANEYKGGSRRIGITSAGSAAVHVTHSIKIGGIEREFAIIFGQIQRTKELGDRPHATVILTGGEHDTRRNFPDSGIPVRGRRGGGPPSEEWTNERFDAGYAIVRTRMRGDHPGGEDVEVFNNRRGNRQLTVEELEALAKVVKRAHAALLKAQRPS